MRPKSEKKTARIAAVADIHCSKSNREVLRGLFVRFQESESEILVLCGDLTHAGTIEEGRILAVELSSSVKKPVVAVFGNHDFEANKQDRLRSLLCEAGVNLLDGESCVLKGIGFAGVKGFGGGFGKFQLQPWGEKVLKSFVSEAMGEELKLESALAKMEEKTRVVLMHYSPIRKTVEGESPEVFPFLGSSRMEGAIDRFNASIVMHGHSHHGSPEGRTECRIPVYNVSLQVLNRKYPDNPGFRVFELSVS